MKVGVMIRSFPLTLTLSRQGRGGAIHPPSRARGFAEEPCNRILMLIGHDELAESRLSGYFPLLHDHFPSDDRMGYFPFDLSAMISIQLALRINLIRGDGPLSIQVTNCEIGIRVREDGSLARIKAKNLGPLHGGHLNELLQGDIAFIHFVQQ